MQLRLAPVALTLSLLAFAPTTLARQLQPQPHHPALPVPGPRPIAAGSIAPYGQGQSMVDYRAGEVRCSGEPVAAEHAERSLAMIRYTPQGLAPVALRFRIDGSGRPLGIIRDGDGRQVANDDLLPSFAAWRFAAGRPRADCTLIYYPVADPVDQVSPDAARRFIALGRFRPGSPPQAMLERGRPAGGDCMRHRPQVLTQTFPRFDDIAAEPASISHTTVAFDIDASGMPTNVSTLSSDGNDALDAAGRKAIGAWRYAGGPRTGCAYPYHRNQQTPLPAPEGPVAADLRDADARCGVAGAWDTPPRLVFPEAYRRRAIEGWAIVAFDVAPWGATGNVRILAAEPTSDFGDAAKRVVESARKAASPIGASGCTERVLFKMSER